MISKMVTRLVPHISTFYRIGALFVTVGLLMLMFPSERQGTHYNYSVGSFWSDNDLYAPFNFNVKMLPDEMEKAMADAKSKSFLYYYEDSAAYAHSLQRLSEMVQVGRVGAAASRLMRKTIDSIYRLGYIETPSDIAELESHTIVILAGNMGSEHHASEFVTEMEVTNGLLRDSILEPNVKFDERRTQLELDSRLSQTEYVSTRVQTGELIVAKGEYVTEEKGMVIRSLEEENDKRFASHYSLTGHLVGQGMLCLIAFVALFMFLNLTRHQILEDNRKITFVLFTILLMSAATAFALRVNPDWVLVVPLCIVPILMHIFFGMRAALYIHLTVVIILANMVPNSFEFIFYQLVTGMMSIISVKNFENRSKFFIVGLVIFATYSLIYTFGVLSQDTNLSGISINRYGMFFANALLTLLAYPLIYVAEKCFGLTSTLTLLELSSTNTPALRELSRKAPGTFQHSMQVANISEDLINEIGGDSLLAKVGALYHDIGKTMAPLNFTENQNGSFNPHDELEFSESARLIIQHVLDGVELARKYHLPASVIDFIRAHHGTTVTGYFFAKQKEAHPEEPLVIADFRYPGPPPFSRETAVVMIVDSVEAACRSLKEHDKEHIDQLVDAIIEDKIRYKQLQNCDLTFRDLDEIRKILKSRMLSIHHARVAYPTVKS